MNDKRPLIVTGLVLLLILVLIGGVIFYLINFIRGRQTTEQATRDIFPRSSMNVVIENPSASPQASPAVTTTPNQSPNVQSVGVSNRGNSKIITSQGFQLAVPQNWGTLTCLNSKNFELDPYNAADSTANCVKAIKPVTFLVGKNSCAGGQIVTLGNIQVRKIVDTNFVTRDGRGTQYHWCTQTTPSVDITHRVGTGTAFAKDDFSAAVEQIISTFTLAAGS